MDDNARPHRTFAVEELLESEDITRMDWPAYSPDLNPIEHEWNACGRRIAALLHHPENTQHFKQMLIEDWVLLPQEMLYQLVLSMQRRREATIAASRRTVLLARWIVRSVPLEVVGSSGHEKVPTRGKPGLERPGRPRGERIEGSCGKHLWTPD
ncbi:transposable element Tc1 transposase [Trichonephila clavipes]|nr:transposable element Tc1 transposase [Trichonephila clavipes]